MRIVITGLPSEVATAKELVKSLFVVWRESSAGRNATPAQTVTVYVNADLPAGTGEKS